MGYKITEYLFGGENSEQYNVLMQSIKECAKDSEQTFYDYIEETPKTSLVVEIVDKINKLGFKIN